MEYLWAQEIPNIKKGRSNEVIYRIFDDATRYGLSKHLALQGKFIVYRGDFDNLFDRPMYRRRKWYDIKRSFRRKTLRPKMWVKSKLTSTWQRIRRKSA